MDQEKKEELTKFFKTIFEGTTGYIDIRTFIHTKDEDGIKTFQKDHFFKKVGEIKDLVRTLGIENFIKGKNIHFGVAPRARKEGVEKQTGSEKDIKIINCFWCDIDCRREKQPELPTKEEKLKELEKFKPAPSIIVDSGLGYHCYWLLKIPIPINNRTIFLEIKGILKGLALKLGGDIAGHDLCRLLRVPGTLNIKPENPKGLETKIIRFEPGWKYSTEFKKFLVKIEDLPEIDINLEDVKISQRFEKLLQRNKKLRDTYLTKNRPDLNDQTGSGYDMALTNILIKNDFDDSEIGAVLRSSKTGKGKEATKQYLAKTISKGRAFEEKREKKKKKKEKIQTLIPGLIHLVKEGEQVGYLLQNAGNFYIEETYTLEDGTICRPKKDLPIYYCGPDILEEPRDIDYEGLLEEIINFIKSYLELPKESNYLILGLWIFHTYLIEKFRTTPTIYFYGIYETGKSRAGEVLKELGFRCETITSPTEAVLFRGADYFKNALIVDQTKLWSAEGNKDIATLIKARYKRGLMVPRINLNKSGEDQIEYYDTFGPMVICTDESMPQDIRSRCLISTMERNLNPGVEQFFDEELAKSLRNKLIVFRANCIEKNLKDLRPISRRRLNEILYPLYQILMEIAPEREDEFRLIVREIEQDKESEEGFTLEADIVSEIVKYYNETRENSFLTSEIVTRLNEGKGEKDKFSDRRISLRIRRLGFEKTRLESGRRGFRINLKLLEKLIPYFKTIGIKIKEENLFTGEKL